MSGDLKKKKCFLIFQEIRIFSQNQLLQVNGINYGAFAAAPALVNPLVTALVNPHNISPSATPYLDKTEKYFTNAEVLDNFPKIYIFAVFG